MILSRIELENWMAFAGRHVLDLPAGPIAVVARYEENPQRSNWAGKTALLEAIEWALFGVHRKRLDDDVVTFGAEGTKVCLTFDDGTVVTRARAIGKPTRLEVAIEGIVSMKAEAQRAIEERLGLDQADYRATLCFAQGDTEAIVERTSGERRKIVAQWLELDAWLGVAFWASSSLKALRNRHGAVRAERERIEVELKELDGDGLDKELAEAEKEAEEASVERERAEGRLRAAAELQGAREAKERLARLREDGKALRDELTGAVVAGLEAAKEEAATLDAEWSLASKEADEAARLTHGEFDGRCPVTCNACPIADEIRNDRKAASDRFDRANEALIKAASAAQAQTRVVSELVAQEREFDRKRERYKLLVEEAKRLAEHAAKADEAPTDEYVDACEEVLARAREEEKEAAIQLADVKADKVRHDFLTNKLAEVDGEEKKIVEQVRVASIASRCVSPTGVPAMIADAALGDLEERANALLADTGLSFVFSWDREAKGLSATCSDCGYAYRGQKDKECPACGVERAAKRVDELEILVDDGSGAPEDVKAKSGGAKVIVASAIRLAAGLMLRELRGSTAAFAQVDEPFGPLDAENRASLARTFAGMLGAVGLEQAFVVSHDAGLLDALPNRIEIVRRGDRSTVEVV